MKMTNENAQVLRLITSFHFFTEFVFIVVLRVFLLTLERLSYNRPTTFAPLSLRWL